MENEQYWGELMECEICRAKPGSPNLCPRCLHNRAVISRLKKEVNNKAKLIRAVEIILDIDQEYWVNKHD